MSTPASAEYLVTDVLVIGQGVAGLMAAFCAREAGAEVVSIGLGSGASGWLQGVNVALGHADPRDSMEAHKADIHREGYGLCDPALVTQTVEAAHDAFFLLDDLGVDFAREEGGLQFRQRHPSGSSFARCCFVGEMMWGGKATRVLGRASMERGVAQRRLRAVRLIVDDGCVVGAVAVPVTGPPRPTLIAARSVVLANGGIGQLIGRSTYPRDISGSSYAMALHAGAMLRDMEFLQFEPLVGLKPDVIGGFVIPTTLFGDGAVLRDSNGDRFLLENRPQGEAGIGKEELVRQMARMGMEGRTSSSGGLWLDCTAIDEKTLQDYPWLVRFMSKHEIGLTQQMVEVWPSAHTSLGGIIVNCERQAVGVTGLYAAGEAAGGIHGAGRLAGGSGTDVIASGYIAGRAAAASAATRRQTDRAALRKMAERVANLTSVDDDSESAALRCLEQEVARQLENAAGITRTGANLTAADDAVAEMLHREWRNTPLSPSSARLRLLDRLLVSRGILSAAVLRSESRGAHLRGDCPELDPAQAVSMAIALSDDNGKLRQFRWDGTMPC